MDYAKENRKRIIRGYELPTAKEWFWGFVVAIALIIISSIN